MRNVELIVAAILIAFGVRSLVYWTRRGVDGTRMSHFVWFSLFVLGRVGCWWAIAGVFLISASIPYEGRALIDEWQNYRWYIMVPLAAGALQVVAAWFLAHSTDGADEPS